MVELASHVLQESFHGASLAGSFIETDRVSSHQLDMFTLKGMVSFTSSL